MTQHGKIKVENTLDSRLEMMSHQVLLLISSLWVLVFKRAYLCNCTAVFLKNSSFYVELA